MPSEEGKQVLALLAEGKIDVDQAYRLLRALGDIGLVAAAPREPPARPPGSRATGGSSGGEAPRTGGRILRIRVTEDGEQKVNVAIPLAIARIGKMTTMKMLATLLIPTSGTISVLGIDVLARPRDVRARLGAMLSGERSLYWKLTARENLEYFAALYHVPPRQTRARIDDALTSVKLLDRADDYVERYSTGMRQRLALARALLPDPPLVILDEPTVGLDPQAARH